MVWAMAGTTMSGHASYVGGAPAPSAQVGSLMGPPMLVGKSTPSTVKTCTVGALIWIGELTCPAAPLNRTVTDCRTLPSGRSSRHKVSASFGDPAQFCHVCRATGRQVPAFCGPPVNGCCRWIDLEVSITLLDAPAMLVMRRPLPPMPTSALGEYAPPLTPSMAYDTLVSSWFICVPFSVFRLSARATGQTL